MICLFVDFPCAAD